MKLIYTTTSPLARKCRIILRELGLTDKIEEIITTTRSEDSLIMSYNPNGMVPTLETDEGYTICETTVICNYLEKQSNNKKFIPQNEKEYWQIIGLDATEKTKSGENFLTTLKTSKIDLSSNSRLILPLLIDQLKTSTPFEEIISPWTVFLVNKPTLKPSFIAF